MCQRARHLCIDYYFPRSPNKAEKQTLIVVLCEITGVVVHTFSPHIEIWIVTEGSVVGREGGGGGCHQKMCFIRLFYRSIRVAIRGSIVQIPD